jgi:deoxyinosine 3'endonuclease (endonuclease V)
MWFCQSLRFSYQRANNWSGKEPTHRQTTKTGDRTLQMDKGEVIGEAVTTKQGASPIYISIGHMVSLETAVEIVW